MKPGLYVPIEVVAKMKALLKVAVCPDEDCDGKGFTVVPDGDGDVMQQRCQWCTERDEVLAEDE